ncbi:hypothetical protein BDQ12DRAFT_682867 [Crucibulum laeve]|uniref:Uncharacterized protein n=1 Tax=Crucibulum laeve TaxID=68775 RepID=A0A5C3M3S0_9AGAR|nr:hypothetical protein BDQ12DRAFT_682867 [Crucibulum laeve]
MPATTRIGITHQPRGAKLTGLKRTIDTCGTSHSSDTDLFETPPRKRFRRDDSESIATISSASSYGSSSTAASSSSLTPHTGQVAFNLSASLRRCVSDPSDVVAIRDFQSMPKGDRTSLYAVQSLLEEVQLQVKQKGDKRKERMLETELYAEWLQESEFVLDAIENMLNAKLPGTRKRVPGLGRITFSILYHLMDEFISAIDAHHDGWSYRASPTKSPTTPVKSPSSIFIPDSPYPPTLTLIEECNDPSTDARSELAVQQAEELLQRYDAIFVVAVKRYKAETGRNRKLAATIGRREYTLARALCLLCEQTGYGSEDDDMGDTLLQYSREAMRDWKAQYAANDEGDSDSDCFH